MSTRPIDYKPSGFKMAGYSCSICTYAEAAYFSVGGEHRCSYCRSMAAKPDEFKPLAKAKADFGSAFKAASDAASSVYRAGPYVITAPMLFTGTPPTPKPARLPQVGHYISDFWLRPRVCVASKDDQVRLIADYSGYVNTCGIFFLLDEFVVDAIFPAHIAGAHSMTRHYVLRNSKVKLVYLEAVVEHI